MITFDHPQRHRPLAGEGDMHLTIDTSVLMAVLLGEPSRDRLIAHTKGLSLVAPPSVLWEVGNALTALLRRRRIDPDGAERALRAFADVPVRYPEVDVAASVALAAQHGLYAYDAYVLECARRYRTPLLSLDVEQQAVARQLGIEVPEL